MATGAVWDQTADVIVVGSGGAALTAAVTAAALGGSVILAERSDKLGGTTAYSGGKIWIPNNRCMRQEGIPDSVEGARSYLMRTSGGDYPEMIEAFLRHGPEMVDFVEAHTPLRFYPCRNYPDYHPEFPGSTTGGRALDIVPYEAGGLGEYLAKIRRSPVFLPFTHEEWERWRSIQNFDFNLIGERIRRNIFTVGAALVAALVQGCLNHGVTMMTGLRVLKLIREGDRVVGVEADQEGQTVRLRAARAVLLASGGFEWNKELNRSFLRGPELGAASPPWNEGDGHVMGAEAGAKLANMSEAWWMPLLQIPGEEADGKPLYRAMINERGLPGSIMVNRAGRRFVNEAHNYNDITKVFHLTDPMTLEHPNIPAWLVFDNAFREKYSVATIMPGEPVPAWVASAENPAELARKLGIDPDGLMATLARFNQGAREGKDPDFRRGESAYDRYYGDPSVTPNANLAPLVEPPYYAIPVLPGTIGTKGGLLTDGSARVRNWRGEVIPGLYAAGNIAAFWMGGGYPGPGASIGPGMTFGYLAGLDMMQA